MNPESIKSYLKEEASNKKQDWISIYREIPPERTRVLITTSPPCKMIARIGNKDDGIMRWITDDGKAHPIFINDKWQPIPE